ncbi:MAG: hypothetical protein U1E62_18105 [Alsobacter sp.]
MQAPSDRITAARLINAGLAGVYAVAILFAAAPAGAKSRAGTAGPVRVAAKAEPRPPAEAGRSARPVRWAANP